MKARRIIATARRAALVMLMAVLVLAAAPAAAADPIPSYGFASPVFDLSVQPDQSLLVADAGTGFDGIPNANAGVVELRNGSASLAAHLPNVAGVAPVGVGVMYAVTGEGELDSDGKVYRIAGSQVDEIADLIAYEEAVNPDGTEEIHSNPFDVAAINGEQVLVADAGANALLVVDKHGSVDWVASFPTELVSTSTLKGLIGCPTDDPFLGELCYLPDMMEAQPVSTSIAIGPDGAYYVGELKGFPGPTGESRVWRIEPGARHAVCGVDPACSVALDGFTGIVDLNFGPDGTLYVVELDEASSVAVEVAFFLGFQVLQGGTVNACDISSSICSVVATGLNLPLAVAALKDGTVYAVVNALIPGMVEIIPLP